MKNYLLWLLPMTAGLMLLLASNHVYTYSQPVTHLEPPRTPFAHSIAATGILEPSSQNIAVGSALSGVVIKVYVPVERVGMRVKAGDPLFQVDDRHLQAELALAKTRALAARAQVTKLEQLPRPEDVPPSESKVQAAKANSDRTLDEYERARALLARHAVSDEEAVGKRLRYQEAAQLLHRAEREHALLLAGAWKPDVDVARAELGRAEAEVAQISTEIDRAVVRAPIDGVVLQVNVRTGERVSDQMQNGLMVLGRIPPLYVRADVDEHDIAEFHQEAKAVLQLRGKDDRHFPLRFVRVEPYVVGKKWLAGDNTERVDTRALQVIYALDKVDSQVYVGQQVDVFVETGFTTSRPEPRMPGVSF